MQLRYFVPFNYAHGPSSNFAASTRHLRLFNITQSFTKRSRYRSSTNVTSQTGQQNQLHARTLNCPLATGITRARALCYGDNIAHERTETVLTPTEQGAKSEECRDWSRNCIREHTENTQRVTNVVCTLKLSGYLIWWVLAISHSVSKYFFTYKYLFCGKRDLKRFVAKGIQSRCGI